MEDLVTHARTRVDAISPADARNAVDNVDTVLDVREAAELESDGAVEIAVHIPRGLVEAQADPETGKANDALIARRNGHGRVHVLCASGARAALAADSLRMMGYDAMVIDGGLNGWKNAGLPLRG